MSIASRRAEAKKRALVAQEHKILTELDHPYLVKCHDAYETDDKLYIFLELMSGGDLYIRLRDAPGGRFDEPTASHLGAQIVAAVSYLHAHAIVHCDLKPSNVLVVQPADACAPE